MRKILVYFLGLFFCTLNTIGQNTDLLWISHFTGTGQSIPSKVTTDVSGNIYVFGSFANTVSQGAFSLTAVGGNDAFIAKYNKNGQILWLKQISGASTETASDIAISSDGAFVFISVLSNTNPCIVSGTSVATTGAFDIILAKFAVDGTLVWAHNSVYGAQNQNNGAMALDNSDNIVLSGGFLVDATFYGGVTTLISPAPAVNQKFISKFDSNGNLTWAKMLVDDNNNTGIRSVSADAFGYYFCGQYVGTLTLDVGVLSNAGNRDMFIYKTDLTGTGQWVRKIVGTGDDFITRHKGDALGFQFITGYYNSPTLTADSTAALTSVQTFPNAGNNDIFYACYASDGTLQFSKRFGSTGDDQGNAVFATLDHIIIGGQYTGAINFDGFPLANSATDAYMVETDRNGIVLSAKRGFGTGNDLVKSANIEADNTDIFVGEFVSANLDIDGKVIVNASVGTRDIFIAKFGLITLNYAVTNVLCNGATTGAIDLTVSGTGTPPYIYSWTGPAAFAAATEDLTGLGAGVYNVTVTDANGATKIGTTTVTEPSAIALVFAITNTKCPASTDGAIDLTVVGGTSPFTYSWTGGITTEDLSSLAAGIYDVTVTDANLCIKTGTAIVANPAAMVLTAAITPPTCVPGGDGSIDLTVLNGTAPYTYSWSNLAATQDIATLVSGTYLVTVTDANLCVVTGSYDVVNPSAPQVIASKTDLTCVPGNDGSIDVLVSGGTIPYTYVWSDGPITTQDRTNLPAGSYIVTVTDAASCSATTAATVLTVPTSPTISFINTNPTCAPGNDGAIDLIVYSGNPPYTYNWTGAITTQDLASLAEGTYDVTVTDSKGCFVTGSSTITRQFPAATITASGVTTICSGSSVQLNANTGTGLSYQWQLGGVNIAGAIAGSYTASIAGSYTVVVTGTNGCVTTSAATVITVNPLPTATITPAGPTSFCTGGSVVLNSTAGVGNTYQWQLNGVNIVGQTAVSYTANASGNYTVVVTNAGCSATSAITTVTVNTIPVAVITPAGPVAFCTGSSVQLNATNNPGCSYQWQESGVDLLGATGTSYTANISGSYTVIITNINSCAVTSAATVVTISAVPIATITPAGPTTFCSGGTVQLDANASVGFTYQWQLNGVDIVGETAVSYIANASGNYTVVVTNAGCSATSAITSVTVTAAPLAVITASGATTFCQGTSVTLMATVGGGNVYQWQESGTDIPGAVSSAFNTLVSGSYTVVVTNINGCATTSLPTVVTVNSYPTLTFAVTNESCTGTNGAVDLTVANGTLPYTFTWDDLAASTTEDLINLVSGTYNVTVTAAGCSTTGSATVSLIPTLTASLDNHELIIFCSSNNNGEATLNIQNGVAPFTYTWAGSASTTAFANDLGVGKSYVTVTDFCGTSIVDSITITSLPSMEISVVSLTQANCSVSTDGSAVVIAVSGIAPYTYNWSGSVSVIDTANDLSAGWHYVTVTDYCGSLIDSVEITSIPALTLATNLISPVSCIGGSNGNANVVATNGVSPFTYNWSSLEINDTAIALVEGWNYVTVTDFCGSIVDSVLMTVSVPLSIAITSSSPTSCAGGNNGGATVTVTNGASPITYQWSSNNLFSDTLNTNGFANNLLNAWNYIRVTDACTSLVDSVQISSLPPVTANITFSVLASCPTTADGKATVTASAGTGVYTYAWGAPSTSTTFVAMDLLPGWNYVTVSDGCGIAVDSVNISNQPALSISITSASLITCQGLANGSAIVNTTDGGAPFTFLWSTSEANDTAIVLVEGWNYVTVTDVCGSLVDSLNVMVTPVVTATYDKRSEILCFGDTTARLEVTPSNGILPYSYAWGDTTLTTFNRINLGAGKYYFTVSDGCNSTYVDSIIVNQPGALSLSMINTNVSFTGLSDGAIDLIMSGGSQPYSYNWSNTVTLEDQEAIPEGVYYITVTDNNGCLIVDSTTITTDSWHIEIYKAFTPNGDGKNDVWNIKYISAYPNCSVTIFNEWGMQVFESTGYETAWDGTNKKGNKLPAATYYYIIDLKDGSKVYTGYVTLVK